MTINQMHNMQQMRRMSDADMEYIEEVQAFQRRKERQEQALRHSDDFYTGYDYEEEPEPVQEDHMLKALDKMFGGL